MYYVFLTPFFDSFFSAPSFRVLLADSKLLCTAFWKTFGMGQ